MTNYYAYQCILAKDLTNTETANGALLVVKCVDELDNNLVKSARGEKQVVLVAPATTTVSEL